MKKSLSISMAALLAAAAPALATDPLQVASASNFEQRILNLEEKQSELYHTLQGKKEAGLASRIAERLTLSGLLEVEASAARVKFDGADTDSASDLSLATAQLTLGGKVSESITGDLSFLYEEGETDLEVDEAAISLSYGPWSGRVGQQYLPFGVFHSHFISDPLTLDLGETRETAVVAGYGNDLLSLSAFVYNGRADRTGGESHLDDWGASLIVTPLEPLSLGGSFISDLADTDAGLLDNDDDGNLWSRRVPGWSAFAIWEGPLDLSAEVLGAARSFRSGTLAGDRPLAWNLEAAYDIRDNLEVALRYEGSREFFDAPEHQYGADVSWSPREGVSLSLEYLRGKFDQSYVNPVSETDARTADRRDLVTAQLALEF